MAGTIVEVTFPAEQFALEHTLNTLETVTFEVEQIVATNSDSLMPFIWITTSDQTTLEEAFTADESVAEFQLIADFETEYLYQLEWVDHIEHLIRILVTEKATVLAARGQEKTWHLRLLFVNRDSVTRTHDYCQEHGIEFDIENIQEFNDQRSARFGLTETQQNALHLAADQGYYSVPRESTAEELAEALGVSHQALSERLRRGHGTLVDHLLSTSKTTEPPETTLTEPNQKTRTD
ncbi:helix-turn-helix domain-containing protein [Haladaptatus sp. CMAA 1911]|uniref:helix-turn-helix domain-containing protein n=1 Tax=unclassified Haladaptatus TaxID=2622732 RepID=UPI0037551989